MQQEKGQIPVIILVMAVIGIIVFFRFFRPDLSNVAPSAMPVSQDKTTIISEQKPSSTTSPSPGVESVPDTTSPFRSNPQPSGGLLASTRQAYIALNTDEKAACRYATVSGVFYEYMQSTFANTGGTFHSTLITGLNEGGSYVYYVRCIDGQGNKNSDDFVISFWVNYPADFTPPALSNAYPTGDIRLAGASETMIGVSTNEPASCRYAFTQGTAYDSMSNNLSPDSTGRYHTANVTGLVPGNTYNYFVRCKDSSGNTNTGDVMIRFTVAP